jgi:hypothetical protein
MKTMLTTQWTLNSPHGFCNLQGLWIFLEESAVPKSCDTTQPLVNKGFIKHVPNKDTTDCKQYQVTKKNCSLQAGFIDQQVTNANKGNYSMNWWKLLIYISKAETLSNDQTQQT